VATFRSRLVGRTHAPPILLLVVGVAAVLRFATLGRQSFWFDEVATADLVRLPFGEMLHGVRQDEGTPPLYYVLAWGWSHLFGSTETRLRSLSAVFGTATVPTVFLIGRELGSRAMGLLAAALVATSPILVWYSQEARSYSLLALLAALSALCFVRALREPLPRRLTLWASVSILALATHYFAVFPVVIEAGWLLAATRARHRPVLLAVAGTGVVGAALIPLVVHQYGGGSRAAFITDIPLRARLDQTAQQFLAGPEQIPHLHVLVAACLVVVGLLVVRTWRLAAVPVLLAGLSILLALAATPLVDRFYYRNVVFAWPLLALAVAAALQPDRRPRQALALTVVLTAAFALVDVDVLRSPELQRDDWRSLVRSLSRDRTDLVVVGPSFEAKSLEFYDPTMQEEKSRRLVRRVAVVGYPFGASFPPHEIDRLEELHLESTERFAGRIRRLSYTAAPAVRTVDVAGAVGGSATLSFARR
jgi:mannosyltransferase